jgi:DNA-binding ferritin-like protein
MPKRNKSNKQKLNNKIKSNKTTLKSRVSVSNADVSNFHKEITLQFFEMLLMIKLFHWKTHSYATHKATDELYSTFNEHMDTFIEVLLGKTGDRIHLTNCKSVSLVDLTDQSQLVKKINEFKEYLVGLTNEKVLRPMSNTDLLNIRDEILGDMNKFLYLLTFK